MEIKVSDKTIKLKSTVRALLIFENITGKTFAPSTVQDVLTYFYCVVIASAKDYTIKFEDFLDALDENPKVLQQFTEWIQAEAEQTTKIKKK